MFEDLSIKWQAINYTVDVLFLFDIFIIFNSGVYDEDAQIIKDRATIAYNYITGWFLVDFVAIIPFEALYQKGEGANLVRYTRIGRLNKVFKLMRLVRLTKLQRSVTFDIINYTQDALKISQ